MTRKLADYEKYIRTEELLSLQKKEVDLCCPDELTFQTIHQISELHFKLIIQYLELAKAFMEARNLPYAIEHLSRVDTQIKHLSEVFNMVKVISQKDYHTIRTSLGQGSGQDSPGFNQILKIGPTLWDPFERMMQENDLTVLELLKQGENHVLLFQLMQELLTFDETFQTLRYHHIQLVKRMIGLDTNSLKGIPAQALAKGIKYEFYPKLWKGISEFTDFTGSSYNPKPLDE